jgi:hypothetical protein
MTMLIKHSTDCGGAQRSSGWCRRRTPMPHGDWGGCFSPCCCSRLAQVAPEWNSITAPYSVSYIYLFQLFQLFQREGICLGKPSRGSQSIIPQNRGWYPPSRLLAQVERKGKESLPNALSTRMFHLGESLARYGTRMARELAQTRFEAAQTNCLTNHPSNPARTA